MKILIETRPSNFSTVVSLEVLNQVYQNDSSLLRKGGYYKDKTPKGFKDEDFDQG